MDTNRLRRSLRVDVRGNGSETEIKIGGFTFTEANVAPEDDVLPLDNPNNPNTKALFERGIVKALEILDSTTREKLGFYAYEVDGLELLVYGLHLKKPHPDALPAMFKLTEIICKQHNITKSRFHTVRAPLVAEAVKNHGFRVSEIILRKDYTK